MAYEVSWYTPEKVLYIELHNTLAEDDLRDVNQLIMQEVDEKTDKLSVVINMMDMRATYGTVDTLRNSWQYLNHQMIDYAYFVTDNKVNRLITLLAFNLARAHIVQFSDLSITRDHLHRKGYDTELPL